MAFYYPKSQVKTNLYTNGGELIVYSTKEEYKGYYFETSTGKKYAGKAPNNRSSILLVPFEDTNEPELTSETVQEAIIFRPNFDSSDPMLSENSLVMNDQYHNLTSGKNLTKSRFLPVPCYSVPTEEELKIGSYFRYFAKKTNEYIYTEISKSDYKKFKKLDPTVAFELYECIELPWNLTKSTLTNRITVIEAQKDLRWFGFVNYFNNDFGAPESSNVSSVNYTPPTTSTTPISSTPSSPSSGGGGRY